MNDKNGGRVGRAIAKTALALALVGASGSAFADRWGLQLGGGVADHDMKKGDIAVAWDPGWTWWEIGGWHFAFVAEGHLSYWRYTGDRAINDSIWEVGAQFGNRQQYQAGLRFQHVSNAGIKDPNPGINFSQLYVQYNF